MQNEDTVSVALCTFNGERFLEAQLASLTQQTRQPNELVVLDDGSTDRTLEILRGFSPSFPVRIHQNATRLGPAQNFAAAMAACSGSIISFCDQDDIWESRKIERTLQAFRSTRPGLVFSDADMCDEAGQSLGYRLWSSVGFNRSLQTRFNSGKAFDVLVRQNVVTGATLSIDARFRPLILPIVANWMHDGWIALLLSAVAPAVAIDEPLIRYRQHASQSIGAAKRSLYRQYLNAKAMGRNAFADLADQYEAVLARLPEQSDYEIPSSVTHGLQEKIRHLRRRSKIRRRETGRFIPAFAECFSGRYSRYSLGWKSFAQDLFL